MTAPTHTFLFADLVGFTALAEAEGDERQLHWLRNVTQPVGTYSVRELAGVARRAHAAVACVVGRPMPRLEATA